MNGKETKCQGICQRLFNFIIKGLTVQALKKSTLGSPTNHGKVDAKSGQIVHPMAHGISDAKPELETTDSSKSSKLSSSSSLRSLLENDRAKDDKADPPTQAIGEDERAEEGSAAQPTALKKMVSMSDRVDDIHKAMKKRKKSKSFDKSGSLGKLDEEDESKPLRSILKVSSNVDEQMDAHVNVNGS